MAANDQAYVFINDQFQGYPTIRSKVNGGAKFDALNMHIRNRMVMPGQLIVVGDETNPKISREEAEMVRLACGAYHDLTQNLARAEGEIIQNYNLLQRMLGLGSLGVGSIAATWDSHLKGVEATLKDIERLHQLSLRRGTPIARQEFLNQRKVLFTKLDSQLQGIARFGTGMHNKGSIKKMLGVSTKSYVHTQELKGYSQRLGHIAKASRLLRAGTPIGIGLNAWSSHLEIKEACSTGREEMCRKAKYIEGSKLVGGVLGGMGGGKAGITVLMPLCLVVFGVTTAGVGALGCGIAAAAIGGYTGGVAGEELAEQAGEIIYEWIP